MSNPLKRSDLDEFVTGFNPKSAHERKPTWSGQNQKGRWCAYSYEDLLKRDTVNLDIFWLKDESLEESAHVPAPHFIAEEIAEDLQAALEQFETIAQALGGR